MANDQAPLFRLRGVWPIPVQNVRTANARLLASEQGIGVSETSCPSSRKREVLSAESLTGCYRCGWRCWRCVRKGQFWCLFFWSSKSDFEEMGLTLTYSKTPRVLFWSMPSCGHVVCFEVHVIQALFDFGKGTEVPQVGGLSLQQAADVMLRAIKEAR